MTHFTGQVEQHCWRDIKWYLPAVFRRAYYHTIANRIRHIDFNRPFITRTQHQGFWSSAEGATLITTCQKCPAVRILTAINSFRCNYNRLPISHSPPLQGKWSSAEGATSSSSCISCNAVRVKLHTSFVTPRKRS